MSRLAPSATSQGRPDGEPRGLRAGADGFCQAFCPPGRELPLESEKFAYDTYPGPVLGIIARPTMLVADAHAAGLKVHPYTFRAENMFLPVEYRAGTDVTAYGRAIDEQQRFLQTGIDGLFTDQADIGVIARAEFLV